MRKYRNKASKRVVLFSFSLERERERERERAKGERGQKHKKLPLFFFSLFLPQREKKSKKKKIERRVLSRARRSPLKNTKKQAKKARTSDPPLREREMKERRNALGIITLHTHDNTRFHHGTQTNLETVHLQNDRVRAFIEPSERCANVQHRHRGVEIRELARVVRSYKLVLPIISVLGELSLRCTSLWCSGTHFFVFFLSLLFSYPFVTRTFHVHIA